MLRQRIENIALGAFVTPFAARATLIQPPVDCDDADRWIAHPPDVRDRLLYVRTRRTCLKVPTVKLTTEAVLGTIALMVIVLMGMGR